MKGLPKVAIVAGLFILLVVVPKTVRSASCEDSCDSKPENEKFTCLEEVKVACEAKLAETSATKATLQSTIDYLDSKIYLTQTQINQTLYQIQKLEREVSELSGKITTVDYSLDQIVELLTTRIKQSYKNTRTPPAYLLLTSDGVRDFITQYKYLKILQQNDRSIIIGLEQTRANYDIQKSAKETKQAEVETLNKQLVAQKSNLAAQQKEKEQLLIVTQNDEARFQDNLNKAIAELAAIQAIVAGKGEETEAGDVGEGEKIASVIPSSSACSSGAHLHFEVVKSGAHLNPFSFLSGRSLVWDNIDPPQNGTGSWNWPLNDPIRITQSYGATSYSSIYVGGIHTGIDMVNSGDYTVKSVKHGTLYQGSIACGGGTLKYVRVDHAEDDYDTFYLHVNYY